MIVFETGKSYRTSRGAIYTVTKCTTSFVTLTNASGTLTFRRKPNCHVDGFEWVSVPGGHGDVVDARKVSEAPVSQPEETQETQKGRKTMTKITNEQAVKAVQSATTAEEVQAVLEQCKKDQLNEVFLAVTGDKYGLSPKSRKKSQLVRGYTARIMKFKEQDEFESKPFEEKYEALVNCPKNYQRIEYICLFSAEEVHAAAERLGLSYDCSRCSLADAVLRELRIRDKVQFVTECAKAKDVRLLKDALIDADFGEIAKEAFSRLIAQLGLAMDEGTSKDTLKMGELLYRYYTESKEPVAGAPCSPNIQEASVIVDDIPADHEPDVQEVNPTPVQEANATTYEAMRDAYKAYLDAEDKYLTSRKTDIAEKAKSDKAFRQYLTLLGRYRQEGMPEREKALSWIREYCEGKLFPVDSLKGRSFDELAELAHKCGLHEAFFKECDTRYDLAVKLIREAGIEDSEKTSYKRKVEARKELQAEIHKLWQKRHALYKAQRVFGEGSADAEALSDVWDQYQDQADVLLGEYWKVCEFLARERESIRRYEADSQLADTLAMAEVAVHNEPESQPTQHIKPKTTLSTKKKTTNASRKTHKPSWLKLGQLTSKSCKHSPAPKPLIKASRAASTLRIRKF